MTYRWIVMDLDGTLCDCSHRVHWAQAKQWDEFHAGIPDDKPNPDAVWFLKAVSAMPEVEVVLCTGRDARHRQATIAWLVAQGLDWTVSELLMRPEGDRSPDHELKLRLVDEFFESRELALGAVMIVLDDRDKVVEAFRDAGFRTWQVQAGSY